MMKLVGVSWLVKVWCWDGMLVLFDIVWIEVVVMWVVCEVVCDDFDMLGIVVKVVVDVFGCGIVFVEDI